MALHHYRAAHMNHYLLSYDGLNTAVVPDRADAAWHQPGYTIHEHLTQWDDYTVEGANEHLPALITSKFYKDPNGLYWWVVCEYNAVLFPTLEIEAGDVLRIPRKNQVDAWLALLATVSPASGSAGPIATRTSRPAGGRRIAISRI